MKTPRKTPRYILSVPNGTGWLSQGVPDLLMSGGPYRKSVGSWDMILAFTSMWICLLLGILLSCMDIANGENGFAWMMEAMKFLLSAHH